MDIASLGISIDTSDVAKATTDLDKLTDAGGKSEGAAGKTGRAWESALSGLAGNTQQIVKELQALNAKQDTTAQLMVTVGKSLAEVSQGFNAASSSAIAFAAAEAKVAETTEAAQARLLAMAKASLEASEYHQSLSKGVSGSAEAMQAAQASGKDWASELAAINTRGQAILATEARLAQETKDAAAATGVQAEGLQKLLGQINPTIAAFQKLDDQLEQLKKYRDAKLIDRETFDDYKADIDAARAKLKGFNDETSKSKGPLDSLALGTKGARENVLQLANALAEGNIRVAAHNILEIGTSAGASALRLAAMVGPIALVAGGLVALAVAYEKGAAEATAFNKALILSGGYAGTTADSLSSVAKQISATVGTTGAAAEALAALAANGNIASISFKGIAEAALEMKEATGKAVDETIAEFVKIAKDPVAAAKDLNEQYNFLTESVYSQIVALKEQGDTVGAAKLLTDTYVDTIKSRSHEVTESLSLWQRGWKAVREEAAKTVDAVNNVGRATPIDQQITELRQKVAYAKSALTADPDDTANQQALVNSQLELSFLTQQKNTTEAIAAAQGLAAENQKAAIDAAGKVDAREKSSLTNAQKRTKELQDYADELKAIAKVNPDDVRLNPATVARNQANINARYKDPKTGGAAVDLSALNDQQNALKALVGDYANSQKELDSQQKAGIISAQDYYTQRTALVRAEKEQVTEAYQAEIAALEQARDRSSTTGAQRIQLEQKIADARAGMVKAQKDSDSELQVLADQEQGRLRRQTQAVQTYTDALQQQVETLRQQGSRAALSLGMGDRQKSLFESQNSIDDRINQQKLDLANQYGDGSRGMSLEEYQQKLAALNRTQRDLRDTVVSNYDAMTAAQGNWAAGASSAFQNYLESARDVAGQTKSLFGNAFSSMEDAVANFAVNGKGSFSDFTKSILADMAKIAARQAASGLFSFAASAVSSYFAGSGTATAASAGSTQAGYTGSDFSNWVAGARATGGPVDAGSMYQVNENGPELLNQGGKTYLMMGGQGGSITPLGTPQNLSPATSGNVNVSVYAPVTVGGQGQGGAQIDQAQLQKSLQQQMQAVAEKAVADSWRAGGTSYRQTRNA